MRYSLIFLVALMVLSLGVRYFADPVRLAQSSPDAGRDLQELCQREPLLGPALDRADRGDVTELVKWINRAEPAERQRLAYLLIRLTFKAAPRDPAKPAAAGGVAELQPDKTLLWQYRHRFRAFLNLDTGDDALDTELDNLVAYTLVTGDGKPSAQDLALAQSLVTRLNRVAVDSSSDEIMDTVGCVHFLAEDFRKATEAFTLANRYATEAKDKRPHGPHELYVRRLSAAERNLKLQAEGKTAEYLPLPPDDEPIATAATAEAAAATSASGESKQP
jgi:hypothetical protein